MAIFMLGTQRSGSNLLRLMLNQLPDITAPHPPHILDRMTPLIGGYGSLEKDENYRALIENVCRLIELNQVPWEGVALDREEIVARSQTRSLMGALEAVYDHAAEARGAQDWCCASLANINYLPAIEAYFRSPRYIYLVRDGRDVAASFRRALVGEKHFYHIAKEWSWTQRLALVMEKNIGAERFARVRYEDLIEYPELTMRKLCEFLGYPYSETMLEFYRSDEAQRAAQSSELWSNSVSPLMRENSGKYRTEASTRDLEIFESVAGTVLDELGYRRSVIERGHEEFFRPNQISVFDAENEQLKKEFREKNVIVDRQPRARQDGLLSAVATHQNDRGPGPLLSRRDRP